MKLRKIGYIVALSLLLALLIPLLPTTAHAAEYLFASPHEGRIGDVVEIDGANFKEHDVVQIYLSSQRAGLGDSIDNEVTAYERLVFLITTDDRGKFERVYSFHLPDALADGEDVEDVHNGDYFLYAVYYRTYAIVAIAGFTVIGGEISLDIEEGIVGTEVEVNGQGLRPKQVITIQYDGEITPTTSGDSQSDSSGFFTCNFIVPESSVGSHTVTAVDESGNTPQAEFRVIPSIAVEPTQQITGGEVQISGTGFAKRVNVTITLDKEEVITTPTLISTNHYGSFEGSFLVPTSGGFGNRRLVVKDESLNETTAQLDVRGGIMVTPATSPTSPGHAGMELVISGTGFSIGAEVALTYSDNGDELPIDTVVAAGGTFQLKFTVPPSAAGSHDINASDATSTASAVFVMEGQAPSTPTPLQPDIAGTTGKRAYFDWSDVSDDSGISYNLQVAADSDFHILQLYKIGLEASEYTLTEEEELVSTQQENPYYWRIKAVDGASNESRWTHPRLFHVGFSLGAIPTWTLYILGVVAVGLLVLLGYWLWHKWR